MVGSTTYIAFFDETKNMANQSTALTTNTAYDEVVLLGNKAVFYLNVSEVPSVYTDETLDVKIYEVNPLTGDEHLIASFTQITNATGTERITVNPLYGNTFKVKAFVGGTAPSYKFRVDVVCKLI